VSFQNYVISAPRGWQSMGTRRQRWAPWKFFCTLQEGGI